MKELIKHLREKHNSEISTSTLHFDHLKEFIKWKEEEEQRTQSWYVRDSSAKLYSEVKHYYFYCNRSGEYKGKDSSCRVRQLKTQGSSKAGKTCIAHMKVTEDIVSHKVTVEYCSTHNSHDLQRCHLPIPQNVNRLIVAKLQDSVPVDDIFDYIRDKYQDKERSREHLIKKQDILNIKRKLNVNCVHKHPNDLLSVCTWVEELKTLSYNPILAFKPQGDSLSTNSLASDTFFLALQTQYQCNAFCKYGSKIVCMDSTHGTNIYDFLLISVLVVDDHGEGVPIAWAISNHETEEVLLEFLYAVKGRVGELHPKVFMSDDAAQYYTAWSKVFGDCTKHLCMWHVDRSWRKALNEHVDNKQSRIEIYHQTRVLLLEQSKTEFSLLLQKFMSQLHQNFFRYYEYFKRTYAKRPEQWATCYRIGCVANTNMFIESFHRLLKVVYLQSKQNRRIDDLLNTLCRIARDLVYEDIRKEEMGKMSHRKCEIIKRHKRAIEMGKSCIIVQQSDMGWKVQSQANRSEFYMLYRSDPCNCKMSCTLCGACNHMYNCSCIDFALHDTVCKHIHLLHMHCNSTQTGSTSGTNNQLLAYDSTSQSLTSHLDLSTTISTFDHSTTSQDMQNSTSTFNPTTISEDMQNSTSTLDPSTTSQDMQNSTSTFNPTTISQDMQNSTSTLDPSTTSQDMQNSTSTLDPSTTSQDMQNSTSTLDPGTISQDIQNSTSTVDPSTTSQDMQNSTSTLDPSTISQDIQNSTSTVDPSTTSQDMQNSTSTLDPSTTSQDMQNSTSTLDPSTISQDMQNSMSNLDLVTTTRSLTSARQDTELLLTDPGTTGKYENSSVANTADDVTKLKNSNEKIKMEIEKMLYDINTKLTSCNNEDCLRNTKRHLQSAISSVTAYEKYPTVYRHTLKETVKAAPNALHKKQLRFFSTKKKKRSTRTLSLKKPSNEEYQVAQKKLRTCEVELCAVCWKTEDESLSQEIDWIMCTKCDAWMHRLCVKQRNSDSNEFYCENCK